MEEVWVKLPVYHTGYFTHLSPILLILYIQIILKNNISLLKTNTKLYTKIQILKLKQNIHQETTLTFYFCV